MGLYFGETELTGLYFGDIELTGLYFGDIEIWAAWSEYDGTLPAQYTANGSMLADYRIYGATVGAGDRTANLFDKTATNTNNGYVALRCLLPDGTEFSGAGSSYYFITEYTLIQSGAETLSLISNSSSSDTAICFYDANKTYISGVSNQSNPHSIVSVPAGAVYFRSSIERGKIRIAMVVEGSTAPAEYVPYGYEVGMSVGPANLFDPSDTTPDYRYDDNGNWVKDNGVLSSGYMKIAAGKTYEYKFKTVAGKNTGICRINFFNASGQWLSVNKVSFNVIVRNTVNISGTAPAGTAFIKTSQYNGELDISMTDVVADTTTTTIYIGSDPLDEDEYISFKEQKVYRMRGGVLTPTDPPVSLPALPTVDGTNIVDYAGQSATASNNVLPSSTAQTQTSGNLSVTCDGEGRYHIDKTGSGDLYVYFDIPEFTIPISKQGGGNGTVSFFNTMDTSAMVFFMNGNTSIDSWQMNSTNRQTDGYGTMAGKTINRIGFNCWGGSWTGDINIMITDNGVLPSAFEPPSHALPKPSRFYAKYKKG